MDDRIGAYIVIEAMKKAKKMKAKVDVVAVTTVGEETSGSGAYYAGANEKPDCAIIVDVTYASDGIGDFENIQLFLKKLDNVFEFSNGSGNSNGF